MGRPVRLRQSYTGDRSWLLKLEVAVERDPRLDDGQRSLVTTKIRELVELLAELDTTFPSVHGKKAPLPVSTSKSKKQSRRMRSRISKETATDVA